MNLSIDDKFEDVGKIALDKAIDIYADWYSESPVSSVSFKDYVYEKYPFLYQVIMSLDEDYIHERLLNND